MPAPDVVIVGGGVIGLSIAYALSAERVGCAVLERQAAMGHAASWAGAGILAPPSERPPRDPVAGLRSLSARLHPAWADRLRDETGIDNGYRRSGGLDVVWDEAEEHTLASSAASWTAEGIPFERWTPEEIARNEPALNRALRAAYYLPGRAQIRNPWHLRALASACERRGVVLMAQRAVEGFHTAGSRIEALEVGGDRIACGAVIVAAGAWSAGLLGLLGLAIATPPVKGQIVLLRTERLLLRRIVEQGKCYLVPRDDGRILIGATEEEAGFDTRPTPQAVRDLLDFALRLCPDLAEAELERSWAGLRPGNQDGRPSIGPMPGFDNLLVAIGHHRAGLQLSTGTAALVADLILGRVPELDLEPFQPGRTPQPGPTDSFRS
jgi:glycine oxidase